MLNFDLQIIIKKNNRINYTGSLSQCHWHHPLLPLPYQRKRQQGTTSISQRGRLSTATAFQISRHIYHSGPFRVLSFSGTAPDIFSCSHSLVLLPSTVFVHPLSLNVLPFYPVCLKFLHLHLSSKYLVSPGIIYSGVQGIHMDTHTGQGRGSMRDFGSLYVQLER